MTIDFKALKAKLNTLKGQNTKTVAIWKPKPGKNRIRIVPWKENPQLPIIELFFHYLDGKTYLSPTSYGRPDPIAEFSDKLRSTGDKEDYRQSKDFRPKSRWLTPVIVRGEEAEGVRFYAFGKQACEAITAIAADEDEWGDITDPKNGRDLVIEFTPQEESDTNFAKTSVRPTGNPSELAESPELVKKFLNEQPDIKEIYKEPSYEELEVVLEKHLNPSEDSIAVPVAVSTPPAEVDNSEEAPASLAEKSASKSKAAKAKLEALFDD